jgi:hypothetical protein
MKSVKFCDSATPIEVDPEYQLPEAREDLAKTENWVHYNPLLLKAGRTTHYIPKSLGEDAGKELLSVLEEKDAPVDRLRGITEDTRNRE